MSRSIENYLFNVLNNNLRKNFKFETELNKTSEIGNKKHQYWFMTSQINGPIQVTNDHSPKNHPPLTSIINISSVSWDFAIFHFSFIFSMFKWALHLISILNLLPFFHTNSLQIQNFYVRHLCPMLVRIIILNSVTLNYKLNLRSTWESSSSAFTFRKQGAPKLNIQGCWDFPPRDAGRLFSRVYWTGCQNQFRKVLGFTGNRTLDLFIKRP